MSKHLPTLSYAVLADAMAETFWAGSPVRWFVVGAMAVYAFVTTIAWTRTTWQTKSWASCLVLLAILAVSAWLPGGLTDGVRLLGLSTTRVLPLAIAAGVAVAGIVLARMPKIPAAA